MEPPIRRLVTILPWCSRDFPGGGKVSWAHMMPRGTSFADVFVVEFPKWTYIYTFYIYIYIWTYIYVYVPHFAKWVFKWLAWNKIFSFYIPFIRGKYNYKHLELRYIDLKTNYILLLDTNYKCHQLIAWNKIFAFYIPFISYKCLELWYIHLKTNYIPYELCVWSFNCMD